MLDRGLGAAGVGISPAPIKGILSAVLGPEGRLGCVEEPGEQAQGRAADP